jgi:hypothetical protein
MASINANLEKLYADKWVGLCNAVSSREVNPQLNHPHLLYIDENESNDAIKVMIFLQNQSGGTWYVEKLPENMKTDWTAGKMKDRMNLYSEFSPNTENKGKQAGRGMNLFIKKLREKYPEKKFYFIWNNIIKIARSDGNIPTEEQYKIEQDHFSVIPEEIQIIKPDILLFLTGPVTYYQRKYAAEGIIKVVPFEGKNGVFTRIFGNIDRTAIPDSKFEEKWIAKLQMEKTFPFVKYAYRTYHPGFLARKGGCDSVFDAIINEIK